MRARVAMESVWVQPALRRWLERICERRATSQRICKLVATSQRNASLGARAKGKRNGVPLGIHLIPRVPRTGAQPRSLVGLQGSGTQAREVPPPGGWYCPYGGSQKGTPRLILPPAWMMKSTTPRLVLPPVRTSTPETNRQLDDRPGLGIEDRPGLAPGEGPHRCTSLIATTDAVGRRPSSPRLIPPRYPERVAPT